MKFNYKIKDYKGEIVEGTLAVQSREEAIDKLKTKGFEIISLTKVEGNVSNIDFNNIGKIFEKASMRDVVNISKQMSALLEAGVSVVKALQLIQEDLQKPILQEAFAAIIQDVKTGKPISQAFAKHPKIFNDFYVNLVKSGEESGKMSAVFTYLADYAERNYNLVVKVRNALIYPAFVVAVFFIVMILIFTLVIPKLSTILTESNVELPLLTKVILGMSQFLVAYGVYILVGVGMLGVYVVLAYRNTDAWTEFFDTLKIRTPFVKDVFKMLYVTRIADNIQTLLLSGVSLTKAIQITSDVVDNIYYRQILLEALADVKAGISFSNSFSKQKELIPNTLTQMLRIGEETGEIGKLMGNIAKFYQREINTTIDTLVGLIEPVMIVFLGLGVGVLLVAVLMPIYNLAGSF